MIAKRIARLETELAAAQAAAQVVRADLAAELACGLLVNSVRLAGWAQRLAKHEAEIMAAERTIQELSLLACIMEQA